MIFEFENLPEQQDLDVIEDLERENVRWIVLSNRAWTAEEQGLGVFGETHARRLAAWIDEEFEIVQEFGDLQAEALWVEQHATRIYRRRD